MSGTLLVVVFALAMAEFVILYSIHDRAGRDVRLKRRALAAKREQVTKEIARMESELEYIRIALEEKRAEAEELGEEAP